MGDAILSEVAAAMSQQMRATDALARYGGDEFTAILPGADRQELTVVGRRLQEAVESIRWVLADGEVVDDVSISVGGAVFPDDALTENTLVAVADRRMYDSKRTGRV